MKRSSSWHTQYPCTCSYAYGNSSWPAQPFPGWLLRVAERVAELCGVLEVPNCVNLNKYVGALQWPDFHADDEPLFHSCNKHTTIISLSFGSTRTMAFTRNGANAGQVQLHTGDILMMCGLVQEHFKHAILRDSSGDDGVRYNLTFRYITSHAPPCCAQPSCAPPIDFSPI